MGAEVELARQWRIEPYYARQAGKLPSPGAVDRVGLVLKYYHRFDFGDLISRTTLAHRRVA